MSLQVLPLPPAELGESPFWHPLERCLYWCDIAGLAVHAWSPADGRHRQWALPSEPGCCAPAGGTKIVIGLRDGFYTLDTTTAALACLARLPAEAHDTRTLRLKTMPESEINATSVVPPPISMIMLPAASCTTA